jgi:high-affinity Fe2+/Pb2+ permease
MKKSPLASKDRVVGLVDIAFALVFLWLAWDSFQRREWLATFLSLAISLWMLFSRWWESREKARATKGTT